MNTDVRYKNQLITGIAQSVERRATVWKAGVRFPEEASFFLIHSVQIGSGEHPASYPVAKGDEAAGT
jgi:hypothetical protein